MAINQQGENATGTASTVVGLFPDTRRAERAIEALKDAGFDNDQIGVAMRDTEEQRDLTERTDTGTSPVGEKAARGAVSGGIIGGLVGLLGSLFVPGVGPIIVAGWLGSTLVGIGVGAAAGGIIGALMGLGVSEPEARHFDRGVREGRVLVTVNGGTRAGEAYRILDDAGADLGPTEDIERRKTATATTADERPRSLQAQRLQLREEQLRVRKEQVQAGEVRVRKEVVTEQRSIDVPVSREEVVIERHPVSGDVPAKGELADREEIRVPIMEEKVRVEKTPVVREEVTLGKRTVQDTRHVTDEVKHEEARVENEGDAHARMADDRGDLAAEEPAEPWRGNERRYRHDASYAGPERRVAMR